MKITQFLAAAGIILIMAMSSPGAADSEQDWRQPLADEISRIDADMPGRLGVYVRHLGDGRKISHHTDRDWYLASTIKVPLTIALFHAVEAGELELGRELELADTDFVDGSGELLWHEPGARFTIEELNLRSLRDSDSTATDMLIRFLGEEALNQRLRDELGIEGLGRITTIVQVRYDAYGEIHPDVARLSNRAFLELRTRDDPEDRYRMLLEMLDLEPDDVAVGSTAEAFERYYTRGLNSGSLEAFGRMLERLLQGELLNETHTAMLLEQMEGITTGDRRIKAGLPEGTRFAHKTGTQIARACNIGIVNPQDPERAVVVAACAENYQRLSQAEQAFQAVGEALTEAGLVK